MILVSSFRPFNQCTPEIKENQLRAHRSWMVVAERLIYVGESCPELWSCLSEFIPHEGRPTIKLLCQIAAQMGTWTAIINADIVVASHLPSIERRLTNQGFKCAISRRYDLETRKLVDLGLDAFFGTQEVWKAAAQRIPEDFTLGRTQWDNWMISWMVGTYGRKCCDLTNQHLIFHPKHQDRLDPNWQGAGLNDTFTKTWRWPHNTLRP